MSVKAPSKKARKLPVCVSLHVSDILGKKPGKMSQAALRGEARHLLSILNDADEWEDYPDQARERQELMAYLR